MKKLILIAIIPFFAIGAHAQSPGPNELHCTEEAFTFRTDIRAGWHFSAPKMGYPDMAREAYAYTPDWNFRISNTIYKSSEVLYTEPVGANNTATPVAHARYTSFYPVMYNARLANQLRYLFPRDFKYPYSVMPDTTKFPMSTTL